MNDGQTHPSQLGKLFEALEEEYDLVYGYYPDKKHNWFRNLGSRFNDLTVNAIDPETEECADVQLFCGKKIYPELCDTVYGLLYVSSGTFHALYPEYCQRADQAF